MTDEPQDSAEHEELNDGLRRFTFICPQCKRELAEFAVKCPYCAGDLTNVFSATYQPPRSTLARIIAWIVLVGFIGAMLWLFGIILTDRR